MTTRGRSFRRGEPGYEQARRATCWNARLADRYPDLIVQANDEHDVVEAIRSARREGMKVGVRSGGHSWSANHVREGGMLLDVSRLAAVTIDRAGMRATAGPGRAGHELARMLAREGLFFPAGHCEGVCLGGYLLQGGFGWHGRTLGPACASVIGIDFVDGEGELRHADEHENPDMFWAARGSGPGFFGVVVRFHLRVYPRPRFIGLRTAVYPIERLAEVFAWAHAIGPEVPRSIELMLMVSRDTPGVRGPGISVLAPVFESGPIAALRATSFMRSRPRRAALALPLVPTPLSFLYRGVMRHYPRDHRYAVDNMWTHAAFDDLLPGLERIAASLPDAPSHMLWMNWAPPRDRSDMAFSLEDEIYIALYGVWQRAEDDARVGTWAVERMRELAPLASGCQLADENLGQRPARFVADSNLERLDSLRSARDPEGRFHPWMGRP
ncbi:FAD-binding oxidoreductase [Nannocystaceae bacterium ST9]